MKSKFDWNKTTISPLRTKAMIYIVTDAWHTFTSHCDETFVTGMAPHHYHLLKICLPATHGCLILGTYHLDPARWTLLTVSKTDRTVLAATKLFEKLNIMPLILA